MDDIDPALLNFIKTKVGSFLKWDMLRFLHENPHTADTVENFAKYIGRNATSVKFELEDLVESDIMQKQMLDKMPVYSLSTDEAIRALVDQFILACEDRHFRVKVVYHIVRKTN